MFPCLEGGRKEGSGLRTGGVEVGRGLGGEAAGKLLESATRLELLGELLEGGRTVRAAWRATVGRKGRQIACFAVRGWESKGGLH